MTSITALASGTLFSKIAGCPSTSAETPQPRPDTQAGKAVARRGARGAGRGARAAWRRHAGKRPESPGSRDFAAAQKARGWKRTGCVFLWVTVNRRDLNPAGEALPRRWPRSAPRSPKAGGAPVRPVGHAMLIPGEREGKTPILFPPKLRESLKRKAEGRARRAPGSARPRAASLGPLRGKPLLPSAEARQPPTRQRCVF